MVKNTKQKDNIVRIEEISKEEAKNIFQWEYHKITEGMMNILETPQDAYQKKIALFNFLKDLEVVRLEEPNEEKRVNCLLLGKLYNEIAKQKMREYKRLTVEEFSKAE
jgi:hypothetical protein